MVDITEDVMPDVEQAMFHPNSLQQLLYEDVVKPYRKENKLRGIGLHIKASGTNEGPIVIYRQIWLKSLELGKEKPVVEIKHPYFSSDVVVKSSIYGKLGRRVKDYIDRLMGKKDFPEHRTCSEHSL